MKIYESAVRKPISTCLLFLGVIIFGLFSLKNLAIDQYPEMDPPYITVATVYAGANAADIETNITRVLEDQLNSVDNLKEITSTSKDNVSMITLEMEWGSDLDVAMNDVRDIVSRTQTLLPDEVDYPTIFKFSSSMMPVMLLSVTADESYYAMDKILDDRLVNVLNRVNGIGSVSVIGQPVREIQVNVDPERIEAFGLTIESIGGIIASENLNVPAGSMDLASGTYNVKADGEFTDSEQLKHLVVSTRGGRTVKLSDVAEVKDTIQKITMDTRANGRRSAMVMIQKQSGANTVEIVEEINKRLPAIEKTLPNDIKIVEIMNGATEIQKSINSLAETVMLAFVFVIIVVMVFLGRWRATFIICMTIPISLVTAFIYLFAADSTLNLISLSSLSIAIGMVVDDAIVVLENITTHIERGSSPKEAAIYGTNEVWLSVIATTLVVVAVFMPLTMVSGMAGILFKELGWIVSIVVCMSTTAAVTLTPMLSAYILSSEGGKHDYKGVGIIYKPIDKFLDWLDDAYARMLTWSVRHRWATVGAAMLLFVVSLGLLKFVPFDFFPPSDNAQITATIETEQNLSMEYTREIAQRIDSIVFKNFPEVELVSARTGQSSANNAMSAMQKSGSNMISYNLRLSRSTERERSIYEIADIWRAELAKIPEISQFVVSPGGSSGGMSGGANVEIKVFGFDLDNSNSVAIDLKNKVSKIAGVRDADLSRDDLRPEYNVVFDREKLALHGLNNAQVSQAVRNRIDGMTASKYREDGDEYDIVVRYAEPFRQSLEDVENINLMTATGRTIKLKEVAKVVEEFAAPDIQRENRQRIVKVTATLAPGVALGDVVGEVQKMLDEYETPDGIDLELGGTLEDQQETFGDLFLLLALIVVLVYIVMATQFESMTMPLMIMISIPFAFTGVFFALWISGTSLSLIALIGAIMLVGIVVKNGIVMVDYTNLLVERGMSVAKAAVAAGKSRLRPVLMTSLTTIFGMVPMAMGLGEGSEIWQPMGVSVIGGLTCSTILTLLVLPALYVIFRGRKAEGADNIQYDGVGKRKQAVANKIN